MSAPSQLLTAEELAARWQVPKGHVYRLARGHQIPVVQVGKYKRFRLSEVERFEENGGTEETESIAA